MRQQLRNWICPFLPGLLRRHPWSSGNTSLFSRLPHLHVRPAPSPRPQKGRRQYSILAMLGWPCVTGHNAVSLLNHFPWHLPGHQPFQPVSHPPGVKLSDSLQPHFSLKPSAWHWAFFFLRFIYLPTWLCWVFVEVTRGRGSSS